MRSGRSILLLVSVTLVAVLLGGGLAVKVGASESSYNQVVTFSEILSLVMDNYVDPVDPQHLLSGAYEGMLGGLDPNGAFLTPAEVAEWNGPDAGAVAGPGLNVLKAGRALQVVAVDEGTSAAEAGVQVGDHIRAVDGRSVRDLSLTQAWRLLQGKKDSTVALELVHPADGFSHDSVELLRAPRRVPPYRMEVQGEIAILRLFDMQRLEADALAAELDDVHSRGALTLLLDLRNLADQRPRDMAATAGLFKSGPLLQLRDRAGRLVETIEAPESGRPAWQGTIAILVNGATAGSGEALASVLQAERGGLVLGETTYGLGAEAKLYELENGSGLLVSSAQWETASGRRWNGDGVQPDELVHGEGSNYAAISADQLKRVLDLLERRSHPDVAPKAA